jgi:iron complex transport system substrate-binding protein
MLIRRKNVLFFFLFITVLTGCQSSGRIEQKDTQQRLISTAPSITEILFDIGAGELVAGDSRFTVFPPEAAKIEKIGGLYDWNPEKILALKPTQIFLLKENETARSRFAEWGIRTVAVDHQSIEGVLQSYEIIGSTLGGSFRNTALEKQKKLRTKLNEFADANRNRKKVRVLLCVDRSRNVGRIENLFVAGDSPMYNEILELAGGTNVAAKTGLPFPSISPEGVLHMAPDVIIELFTGEGVSAAVLLSKEEQRRIVDGSRKDWQTLGNNVPAVKNDRIAVILDDYATVPGPRLPLLAEQIANICGNFRPCENTAAAPN